MKKHNPRFLAAVEEAKSFIREITAEDFLDDTNAWILVDVREDREWNEGYVDGAVHMSKGIIERDIEKRFEALHTPLVLYCGGGYRSALAAVALKDMGYTQVFSLTGGFRALKAAGATIVGGT